MITVSATSLGMHKDDSVIRQQRRFHVLLIAVSATLAVLVASASFIWMMLLYPTMLSTRKAMSGSGSLYYTVTDKLGRSGYLAKPVEVDSSPHAMDVAYRIREKGGAFLAGAYFCPRSMAQKQLLGKQVWASIVPFMECSPDGYAAQPDNCAHHNITEYPTWIFPKLPGQPKLVGVQSVSDLSEFLETMTPPMREPTSLLHREAMKSEL